MNYHKNFEEENIDVYSYIFWKDIQTHVALFDIPMHHSHLKKKEIFKKELVVLNSGMDFNYLIIVLE